ncbi:hypothetical protein FRC03_002077 [Tulasnella sp. 419]|nr:hypothetical protein FRC03_002077 [Tulasnella sp. 419]
MSEETHLDTSIQHATQQAILSSDVQEVENRNVSEIPGGLKEPRPRDIDNNDMFWKTYLNEARKYDHESLESWNESLSSLLLFAALFSAINTAFIIEAQKGLQPDEAKKTNELLEKIVGYLEHTQASEPAPTSPWKPNPSTLWLNGFFFASLSFSLIASFGAILGKEMLAEYKASGALHSPAEQGQTRQEKFDGLQRWRFRVLIHLLPVLLQTSLALFLIGLVVFLWQMSPGIAMVVFVPVVLGFIGYIASLVTALRHHHSPFQTSISKAIRLFHEYNFRQSPIITQADQSIQGISDKLKGGENGRLTKRKDEVQAACVAWLLERAETPQVLWQALDAVMLLPPRVLHPFFRKKKILHRCLTLYNSNLQRRPGQAKYIPDEAQTKMAIVSGSAIYHVMKSRSELDHDYSKVFELGGDPDLFDILKNPDFYEKYDFLLITVVHCVQSQVGVEEWDVKVLLNLLQKCMSRTTVTMKPCTISPLTSTNDGHPPPASYPGYTTSSKDVAAITLLLDSIIYCSSQCHLKRSCEPILSKCAEEFEQILETLPKILESRESVMLASHAAIAISAVQWYKGAYHPNWRDPTTPGLEVNGVHRESIRSAWFAVDKSAKFIDNVVIAFKLMDTSISPATMRVYMSLMRLYERFHINSMSVSWKHREEWYTWWITAVQMIPGLLHIFSHVDDQHRVEVTRSALRIIAQILPNDWMARVDGLRNVQPVPQLRYITPQNSEYGERAISLMASFLGSPVEDCRITRISAAEVLGWMMTLYEPRNHPGLPPIITDPDGMYQQSTSVPSFLLSVIMDQEADERLHRFLQPQFDFMLNLPPTEDDGLSKAQLEALVISLTHLSDFPDQFSLAPQIRNFWDRAAGNLNVTIWPDSFAKKGLVILPTPSTAPGIQTAVPILVRDVQLLLKDDATRLLWTGSAIPATWKHFVSNTQDPAQFSDIIFANDALLTVLNCYDMALREDTPISFPLFDDYLQAAQLAGKVSEELKKQVEDVRNSLKSAMSGEWDSLVFQKIH